MSKIRRTVRHRSAKSGQFVTEQATIADPNTTVKTQVVSGQKKLFKEMRTLVETLLEKYITDGTSSEVKRGLQAIRADLNTLIGEKGAEGEAATE